MSRNALVRTAARIRGRIAAARYLERDLSASTHGDLALLLRQAKEDLEAKVRRFEARWALAPWNDVDRFQDEARLFAANQDGLLLLIDRLGGSKVFTLGLLHPSLQALGRREGRGIDGAVFLQVAMTPLPKDVPARLLADLGWTRVHLHSRVDRGASVVFEGFLPMRPGPTRIRFSVDGRDDVNVFEIETDVVSLATPYALRQVANEQGVMRTVETRLATAPAAARRSVLATLLGQGVRLATTELQAGLLDEARETATTILGRAASAGEPSTLIDLWRIRGAASYSLGDEAGLRSAFEGWAVQARQVAADPRLIQPRLLQQALTLASMSLAFGDERSAADAIRIAVSMIEAQGKDPKKELELRLPAFANLRNWMSRT